MDGGEEGTEVISCGQTAPLSVDRDERIDHGKSALLVFICCLNHFQFVASAADSVVSWLSVFFHLCRLTAT